MSNKDRRVLAAAQQRPTPQVGLGLAAAQWASAAIDLSDGLLADLGHLCAASRVGAELSSALLPISPEAIRADPTRALDWALSGGEDYQLLIAIPARHASRLEAAAARLGTEVSQIGAIRRGGSIALDGHPAPARKGFDHFGE